MRFTLIHSNADYVTGMRLPLLQHFRTHGSVTALAPNLTKAHAAVLAENRVEGHRISLNPTGLNPMVDLVDTVRLAWALRRLHPDIVISNTAKPVIFGTIAARLAGVRRRVTLVSGLGYAFTDDGSRPGRKKRIVRAMTARLYRLAFALSERVIFQNADDLRELVAAGICPAGKAVCISGSGIETASYEPGPAPAQPAFIMVSRLLTEKGVLDYLAAAREVRARLPTSRFLLVGGPAPNPSSIDPADLEPYLRDGTIEWPGEVRDVRPWLAQASVFVLPSYREGIPRSTLEAMAMGLAILTTDAPGCRETVVDSTNGELVPVRDVTALSGAMERMARDPARVAVMGAASRRIAETRFDIDIVHRQLDAILGLPSGREGSDA